MEYYSYSTSNTDSSSSASYSHSSTSSTQFPYQYHQEQNTRKTAPAFRSALHSVRKFPTKNKITKQPIAPLPPTPPKIYKVDRVEFKEVVQRLTGAAEFQQTRLQEVAPPPLSLSPPRRPLGAALVAAESSEEKQPKSFENTYGALSPLGFSLSPSSLAWCSAMLFSPRTLASLEPSAIL